MFSTAKLRKGIENMKKLYGEFGYIDFVPEPSFDTNDKTPPSISPLPPMKASSSLCGVSISAATPPRATK